MPTTINASASAGLITTADTSTILQLQTGGTTGLTVSAAQVVTLANPLPVASGGSGGTTSTGTGANVLGTTPSFTSTIGVGGATASASGAGITFPAVFNASSDVNTLDDYEEGSWSPTFSGFTIGNATSTAYEYVKIGRICLATVSFVWGSTSTSTSNWGISLPFTAANSGGGAAYALDNGSSEYAFSVIVATGTYGSELRIGDGTGAGLLGGTSPFTWASGDRFQLGVTYMTA